MSLIAEFRLELPFVQPTLSAYPEATIELEHHAALDEETSLLVVLVTCEDLDGFTETLRMDETVESVRDFGEVAGRKWLWIELKPDQVAYWRMAELGAVVLRATATHRGWTVAVRFPSRDALAAYRAFCREQDYAFTLLQLYQASDPLADGEYGLSDPQREFLEVAVAEGFFEVPRGVSLSELADRFDISDQAASQRLRRGLATLLDRTLMRSATSQ